MKRAEASVDAIDTETRSKIRVFADSEVTNAFIRGIDFNLERRVYGALQHAAARAGRPGRSARSPTPIAAKRESSASKFQAQLVPQYFDAFRGMIGEYQQHAFINPVLRVLEIAASRTGGNRARTGELNVFKKRIMAQKQTVGGAIDVAVISREDGFQWWTRQSGG